MEATANILLAQGTIDRSHNPDNDEHSKIQIEKKNRKPFHFRPFYTYSHHVVLTQGAIHRAHNPDNGDAHRHHHNDPVENAHGNVLAPALDLHVHHNREHKVHRDRADRTEKAPVCVCVSVCACVCVCRGGGGGVEWWVFACVHVR